LSLPRSARGANPKAAAKAAKAAKAKAPARASGRPGVFVQTPKSDIFVVMLSVALGALVLGCLLLALIMNSYEWSTQVADLGGPIFSGLV